MSERTNSAAVVRKMSDSELDRLDEQIRVTEKLIGDRRKEKQGIDFDDRRTQADRRVSKTRNF